jgi:ABC-type multidrug transport system permease subunit
VPTILVYGWFAFTVAAIIPEYPWSFVAGTLYWCCWYWAAWFPRDTYTLASMWIYVSVFEVFYVSFGQAIASFASNELLASLFVPLFFLFVVSFCGVVVPYAGLP